MLLATGGFGRMFKVSSNAYALTGDGPAIAYRHGLPLEDMEFFQFHPTGIYRLGILLSEACRGDGGIMFNKDGERFMERYAPNLKDLASRDVCSRSIYQEVRAGRGVNGKDYVYLDIRAETMNKYKSSPLHPGQDVDSAWVEKRLPDIIEFAPDLPRASIRSRSRCRSSRRPTTRWAACRRTSTAGCSATPTDPGARPLLGR